MEKLDDWQLMFIEMSYDGQGNDTYLNIPRDLKLGYADSDSRRCVAHIYVTFWVNAV